MTKKRIVATFTAGLAFGAMVGLKITLDVYDFGYKTGFKAAKPATLAEVNVAIMTMIFGFI